jgi:hypothetical protein
MTEQRMYDRLEDFISLARKGKKVDLTVTLNKEVYTRKFALHTTEDLKDKVDIYIFSANYVFVVKGKASEVTKIYAFGFEGEPSSMTKRNIAVADQRLKMDYERLMEADFHFSEKFWRDQLWGRF